MTTENAQCTTTCQLDLKSKLVRIHTQRSDPSKRAMTPDITTQSSSEEASSDRRLLVDRTRNRSIRPGYII